jgi:hypothetical protein
VQDRGRRSSGSGGGGSSSSSTIGEGGVGVDTIQAKQKRGAREQRTKYKRKIQTGPAPSNQPRRQAGRISYT